MKFASVRHTISVSCGHFGSMPPKYDEIRNTLKELATLERYHGKWIKDDNVVDIIKVEKGGGIWDSLDKDVLNRATGRKWNFIRTTSKEKANTKDVM